MADPSEFPTDPGLATAVASAGITERRTQTSKQQQQQQQQQSNPDTSVPQQPPSTTSLPTGVSFYTPDDPETYPSSVASSYANSPKISITHDEDRSPDEPEDLGPYPLPIYNHKNNSTSSSSNSISSKYSSSRGSLVNLLRQFLTSGSSNNGSGSGGHRNNAPKLFATATPAKIGSTIILILLCLWFFVSVGNGGNASRPAHIINPTKNAIFTDDPLIYPDLTFLSVGSKKSLGGKKSGPNKAPGDYAPDSSDSNVPAAAKGSKNDLQPKDQDKPESSIAESKLQAIPSLVFKPENPLAHLFDSKKRYPPVVLVTVINPDKYRSDYLEKIIANRKNYAKKFGYGLYVRLASDFKESQWSNSPNQNPSWAKIAATRAALHAFPLSHHFWYVDQTVVLTDFDRSVETRLIEPAALRGLMLRGIHVLKNFEVIKTYKNTGADSIKLILTQDGYGVVTSSFLLANVNNDGRLFASSLLDYWGDLAYVSYNQFEDRADQNALNHFLLWHPSYLSKTAIVSTHALSAYSELKGSSAIRDIKLITKTKDENGNEQQVSVQAPVNKEMEAEYKYFKGDLSVFLTKCEKTSSLNCLQEMSDYYKA
ncbi:uncharacterized protein SAPINGB_P002052 [Magnusiomyces paraingens]|uniref:Glycosyltransferase family 34 protein n=1 Tax=Magnusiomyces paraingens TaxID=2606893 RepID=A0A5E8BE60_9ASCO|nr:uncharacterized protein SAPINGB_P002052 [Saprochaete ingens]VVT48995.1 unnamed protein product [Saprochaete ingens]